jgi:hypothetical protein
MLSSRRSALASVLFDKLSDAKKSLKNNKQLHLFDFTLNTTANNSSSSVGGNNMDIAGNVVSNSINSIFDTFVDFSVAANSFHTNVGSIDSYIAEDTEANELLKVKSAVTPTSSPPTHAAAATDHSRVQHPSHNHQLMQHAQAHAHTQQSYAQAHSQAHSQAQLQVQAQARQYPHHPLQSSPLTVSKQLAQQYVQHGHPQARHFVPAQSPSHGHHGSRSSAGSITSSIPNVLPSSSNSGSSNNGRGMSTAGMIGPLPIPGTSAGGPVGLAAMAMQQQHHLPLTYNLVQQLQQKHQHLQQQHHLYQQQQQQQQQQHAHYQQHQQVNASHGGSKHNQGQVMGRPSVVGLGSDVSPGSGLGLGTHSANIKPFSSSQSSTTPSATAAAAAATAAMAAPSSAPSVAPPTTASSPSKTATIANRHMEILAAAAIASELQDANLADHSVDNVNGSVNGNPNNYG